MVEAPNAWTGPVASSIKFFMQAIPESDWRQFKQVHQALLQRFCERTLNELAGIINSKSGMPHERYLQLYRLVQKRDRELGRAFNDYRRSTAMVQLAHMRAMGLLTDEELSRFSEEAQTAVRFLAER